MKGRRAGGSQPCGYLAVLIQSTNFLKGVLEAPGGVSSAFSCVLSCSG